MKTLSFIFRKSKSDQTITLYGFRTGTGAEIRLIDDDKKSLDNHVDLLEIAGVQQELDSNTWSTQKTIHIQLPNDLYDFYLNGDLCGEYDTLMENHRKDAGEATPSAPSFPSSSLSSNPNDLVSTVAALLSQQQQSNMRMMEQLVTSMSRLMDKRESKKMTVTRFDGTNEDARTWLIIYERACDANKWDSDDTRINNLKASFVPGSAADRWFSSRIIDEGNKSWEEWVTAFLEAFSQNKIQAATRALRYEYRHGSLMDYYYEKERLLKIAFHDLGENSFMTHVILGLPHQLQGQILSMDPKKKTDLILCLQKLPQSDRPKRDQSYPSSLSVSTKKTETFNKQEPSYQHKKTFNQKNDDKKKVNKVTVVEISQEKPVVSNFVNPEVNHVRQDDGRDLPVFTVICNGILVKALFDSGSNLNLISEQLVCKHDWRTTRDTKIATAFNGKSLASTRKCNLQVSFSVIRLSGQKDIMIETNASVFPGITSDLILGYPFLLEAGIDLTPVPLHSLPSGNHLPVDQQKITSLPDIETIFPAVLRASYTPQHEVTFSIDSNNIIQCKPYRLSKERFSWLQKKIDSLLESNFIRCSKSSWASPVVIVTKENGDYRLCVDFRRVNEQTVLDPFPFPLIDDVIVKFGGCNFFSKFDLRDGFNQVGLQEESRQFTAFVTPFGLYEWNRLPFGWKNSPPVFQRVMHEVLGDLLQNPNISVYIDDIICGSKSLEENKKLTFLLLQRLDNHGMTINVDKCHFNVPSVVFLGRKIDGQTKTTKEESVIKVNNMDRPKDLHSLRVFLGLTGHFRAYIPDYANIARPLDNLRKKDTVFEWDEKCEIAFCSLKKIISSNPILSLPDWNLPFELCTDASNFGTGSILYQRDKTKQRNKQLRVIGFQSYTFTSAEMKYTVTEKECLAVLKAIDYFKSYLEGRHFTVNTDHSALTSLLTLKEAKNRLGRWQTKLLSYNIQINHRKGIALKDADAISRLCLDLSPHSSLEVNHVVSKDDEASKKLILRRYHDDPDSGGHDGKRRLIYKITQRFKWQRMRKDIEDYVDSCHECQLKKFKYRKKLNFLTVVSHASSPYETVHLDFGELQKKSEGVKKTKSFILLVDEFTRMVHTKPLGMKSTQLIKWMESLTFMDKIKRIISDNAKTFDSQEFHDFAKKKGIKLCFASPYHPPGNGMAERHVQEIKMFVSLYPSFAGGWKRCIESATWHHNRSYCSSIGCTPLFKLTGKATLLPADKEFAINEDDLQNKESCLPQNKQTEKREQVVSKQNAKQGKIPEIKPGDQIIYQAGFKGKDPVVKGPVVVDEVIMRDNIPKTLIFKEGKEKKAVALKNALPYKNRIDMKTLAIVACVCLLYQPLCQGFFRKESPLLWTRSSIPIIGEVRHYEHKVVLENFCGDFLHLPIHNQNVKQNLVRWCLSKLSKEFWEPFRDICSTNESSSHQIHKRVIDPLSISVLTVAFTFLFATSTTSLALSWKDHRRIDVNRKNLDSMRLQNLKNKEYLDKIVTDLINVTKRLETLEQDFNQFYSIAFPEVSTFIADTSSSFTRRAIYGKDVRNAWMSMKLSRSFFDLFNFQIPHGAILDQAQVLSCIIKEQEGYLFFDYLLPLENPDIRLFEANAFEIKTAQQNNETGSCAMVYEGPKFALLSKDCVYALNSDVNTIAQTAFIFQENQACQTNTLVDERKYWTRGRCYDVETFLDQIKLTSGGSFIYCPDHQINLDGHSQSCPNYVFSLPKGTNFVIGSYNYSSKVWLNAKNFSIVDHLRINSFIFPQTQKELSLIPGLEHLLKIIRDNDVWFFDSSDSWLPVVTYILPVLLILLAIMYLGYRLCRRCYANNELSAEARTLNIIAEHQPHIVATEEA